jgi:hypothetical protein
MVADVLCELSLTPSLETERKPLIDYYLTSPWCCFQFAKRAVAHLLKECAAVYGNLVILFSSALHLPL